MMIPFSILVRCQNFVRNYDTNLYLYKESTSVSVWISQQTRQYTAMYETNSTLSVASPFPPCSNLQSMTIVSSWPDLRSQTDRQWEKTGDCKHYTLGKRKLQFKWIISWYWLTATLELPSAVGSLTKTWTLLKHYCHNWWLCPKMNKTCWILFIAQCYVCKMKFPVWGKESLMRSVFSSSLLESVTMRGCGARCDWDYKSIGKVRSSPWAIRSQDEPRHSF